MSVERQIININEYELLTSAEDFTVAIRAVAERTEREGHLGVLSYRFFVDEPNRSAGACITYADADAWLAHHDIAYGWEEMPNFQKNVKLARVLLLGPLHEGMRAWLEKANIPCEVFRVNNHAAGFER